MCPGQALASSLPRHQHPRLCSLGYPEGQSLHADANHPAAARAQHHEGGGCPRPPDAEEMLHGCPRQGPHLHPEQWGPRGGLNRRRLQQRDHVPAVPADRAPPLARQAVARAVQGVGVPRVGNANREQLQHLRYSEVKTGKHCSESLQVP